MKTVHGNYADALIFTDVVEETALEQVKTLCDQPFVKGRRIRLMPDIHAGAGCTIGFTADLGDMVIPNIVGVDIGCGMLTVELGKSEPDYVLLDEIIRQSIPSGMNVHNTPVADFPNLHELYCFDDLIHKQRLECSIGTLGGGNHFIEVDKDNNDCFYLVIHTGSRNLGKQVAEIYQNIAVEERKGVFDLRVRTEEIIREYKATGRMSEIQSALQTLRQTPGAVPPPKELCYVTGENRMKYLHDMKLCQEFAVLNRKTIANRILSALYGKGLDDFAHFETIHNYIDHESNIIRKGAVSAQEGERLLIPINMRDGSLICVGKGNPDWNYSAPHGAGRLFSRAAARENFSLDDYRKEMEGIYSTSVVDETLDECPMAYKPMESIVKNIAPTAEIIMVIKPTFNYKAN